MKEIDFDELDRAVSSLMSNVPKSEPVKDDGDIKTITLSSNAPADDATPPSYSATSAAQSVAVSVVEEEPEGKSESEPDVKEEPAPAATPISVSRPRAASPAVQRGRFMDVMRSSAKDSKRPVAPTRVSRQGTTLQPVTSSRSAAVDSPFRSLMSQSNATESRPEPETPAPAASENNDRGALEEIAAKIDGLTMSPVVQPNETASTPENDITSEPVSAASPFLPGAQVEKRPLGGRGRNMQQPSRPSTETTAASANITSDIAPDADAQLPEQPLPAELDSKLLSIETSTDGLPDSPPVSTQPAPVITSSSTDTSSTATNPSTPATANSQSESDEQSDKDIYDPSAYHQPLAHPAKKQRDWLLVASIAVIILLGVAGGVAVYYFKLI